VSYTALSNGLFAVVALLVRLYYTDLAVLREFWASWSVFNAKNKSTLFYLKTHYFQSAFSAT